MCKKLRHIAVMLIIFVSVARAVQPSGDEIKNPKLIVYIIDVGMGDAIFLDIPPKDCMLIDAGSWDGYGIDNLMNFLKDFFSDPAHSAYENTIDVALATHQHKDHIQGFVNVIGAFKVTTYIDNGVGCRFSKSKATALVKKIEKLLKSKSVKHEQIYDKLIEDKGVKGLYTDKLLDPFDNVDIFAISATPSPASSNENDNSIVLKVQCDSISFLLTGDAEKDEEDHIINRLKGFNNLGIINSAVYKAGHHGSSTANSELYLQTVKPKIGVISVGEAEFSSKTRSYRLPKESALKLIDKYTGASFGEEWECEYFPDKIAKGSKNEKPKIFKSAKEIYLTSSDGTVIFKTDGRKLEADLHENYED